MPSGEWTDGAFPVLDPRGFYSTSGACSVSPFMTTVVRGFAKFVVIKKLATKARKGVNPFTKEPTVFKAKPARKIIRARPVKAAKDAVS
jgi:DNA-binding protein HU-beta